MGTGYWGLYNTTSVIATARNGIITLFCGWLCDKKVQSDSANRANMMTESNSKFFNVRIGCAPDLFTVDFL